MSDAVEISGNSPNGVFQDALNQAVFKAMETLKSDAIEWTLVRTTGVTSGTGYRSRLVVVISAKVAS